MASIKEAFGGATTINPGTTIQAVANGGAWQTAPQDNSTNLYLDVLVTVKVKTGATVTSTGSVTVYAYGSPDGSTYPDTVGTSEGTLTLNSPTQLRAIGVITANVATTTFIGGPYSVALAFNGSVPTKWGIILVNQTGGAWDGTNTNFAIVLNGVYATSI